MKIGSFFVKLISCLFVLIFGLLCLITSFFLLARNMTSHDSIDDYVKTANIFDYKIRDVVSKDAEETLRQTIKKDLLNMDIPALVVDDVLDSNEVCQFISDYIYDYSRYVLYDSGKPVFPKEKLVDVVKEKYTKSENKSLSEVQLSKLSAYIDQQGDSVDQGILDKSEINDMFSITIIKKIANVFESKYMPVVLLLVVAIIFAIISICLSSIKKAINWCGKIITFDGVFLIIASFVEVKVLIMYFNSQGLIDSLAIAIIENGFKNMLTYGIILVVIGLIFIIVSAILLKKEKNRKPEIKKVELPQLVEEQPKEKEEVPVENKEQEDKEPNKEEDNKLEEKKEVPVENKEPENKKLDKEDNKLEEKKEVPVENKEPENKELDKEDNKLEEKKEEVPVENKKQENIPKQNKPNNNQNNNQKEQNNKSEKSDNDITVKEVTVVPVVNEKKEVFPKVKLPEHNTDYIELKDEVEDTPEIVKEDIKVTPIETVKVNLINPEKGKDIENIPEDNTEPEEEIELL